MVVPSHPPTRSTTTAPGSPADKDTNQGLKDTPDVVQDGITEDSLPSVESPTSQLSPPPPQDLEPSLRRSSRPRTEPHRLNIGTWKGKSYGVGTSQVNQMDCSNQVLVPALYWNYPSSVFGFTGVAPNPYLTALHSVGHSHDLHHSVPGGGGGISGYDFACQQEPSLYQTQYGPDHGSNHA